MRASALRALVLVLVFAGCEWEPTTPLDIDDDLLVYVREAHGAFFDETGTPRAGLFLATERIYDCANYQILMGAQLRTATDTLDAAAPDTIRAEVHGIRPPRTCQEGAAPATAAWMLRGSGQGPLVLTIRSGDRTDRYRVHRLEDRIEVEPEATPSISRAPHPVFWNYPPQSFAFLCRMDSEEMAEQCAGIEAALAAEAAIESYTFPSGGAIPYPVPDPEAEVPWHIRYFRYDAETTFSGLSDPITAIEAQWPDLAFFLVNWRNERLPSPAPDIGL